MSTLQTTNIKNASSASNNIVLDTAGNATVAGTMAMGSSFLRNRIINGDMRIDQRNAGAAITGPAGYFRDRWRTLNTQTNKWNALATSGGITPPAGFTAYNGITSSSAYTVLSTDAFNLTQPIEGLNVYDLGWGTAGAQSITVSFWVRSSLTGTFSGAILNSDFNRSYTYTYTISAANTWEYKTVTIPGDTTGTWLTTNGVGIRTIWNLGCGSGFQTAANTWTAGEYYGVSGAVNLVATNGATWYITGVQLEPGTVATPFERRQYGQELALCQRYYEKGYPISFAPGTPINYTTNVPSISVLAAAGSGHLGGVTPFKVTKRISGSTVTIWDNAGNSGKVSTNAGNNQTATVDYISDCSFRVYRVDASTFIIEGFWAASAEL